MDREELHRLIDTLPEVVLEQTKVVLDRLQTWPPKPPPELEWIRQEHRERTRQVMSRGGGIGGSFVGGYELDQGRQVRNGRSSFGYYEDGNAVRKTHQFHEGIEITITEKMCLGENGKTLLYWYEIVGPDGKKYTQDITFRVDTSET